MSKLYNPYKVLGLYSSHIPLIINETKKNDHYIFSAVGHYFLVYRLSDLAIIGTSDRLEETILSMSSTRNIIFCGCKSKIIAFKRAKHAVQKYRFDDKTNWNIVVAFEEDGFLCGVSESNFLVVWNIAKGKAVYSCQFPAGVFDISYVMQPRRYTHKILVASIQGNVHIINFQTQTTLYTFSLGKRISVMCQTPNDNVIAVGCSDGSVLIHDVLYDKTLITVKQDVGAVSSITFREGSEPVMITGSEYGHVTMWNLETCRNIGQTRDCHHSSVASLFSVPGKPWLVSNSVDNSIKVWNYERPDGTPLLLRSRSGHWLPPLVVGYWPGDSKVPSEIISGGGDSVINVFNSRQEKDNFSLGRGYLPHHNNKREDRLTREQYVLPPPCEMACCATRDGVWDSVCVCHAGKRQVTTWSYSKRSRGQHYLDYSGFKSREHKYSGVCATKCAMSGCGNFVVVGYSSGHCVRYNVQSGIERGVYGSGDEDAVTGLCVGLCGTMSVVVVASASGTVSVYALTTHTLLGHVTVPGSIEHVIVHPNDGMVAVSTRESHIYLIELTQIAVIRHMTSHVTGMAFCSHSQRLVIADGCLIKTFDYVHQRLVDVLRVCTPVTKLAMACNDSVLVTCHAGDLGLYMWSLSTTYKHVLLPWLEDDHVPEHVTSLPGVECDGDEDGGPDNDFTTATCVDIDQSMLQVTRAIDTTHLSVASSLATYTHLPSSYLASLLNVDQARVQSEMAVRGVASSTLFFLPQMSETLDGIKWRDDASAAASASANKAQPIFSLKRRHTVDGQQRPTTSITDRLHALLTTEKRDDALYDGCVSLLTTLSAPCLDTEIVTLDPVYHDGSTAPLNGFISMIINQITRQRSIDLCHLYLAVLLAHNVDSLLPTTADSAIIDPLYVNEDVTDNINIDKLATVKLINQASELVRYSNTNMLRQQIQVQQMAILASHK